MVCYFYIKTWTLNTQGQLLSVQMVTLKSSANSSTSLKSQLFILYSKQCPTSAEAIFLSYILAQFVYSTTKVLPSRLLGEKSCTLKAIHKNMRVKLASLHQLEKEDDTISSVQCLWAGSVLPDLLDNTARKKSWAKTGRCTVNNRVMEWVCSALSDKFPD